MKPASFLIGLDFGSASARGVLIDASSNRQVASHSHAYRHGVMSTALPDGTGLPPGWALQCANDYLEAAESILARLGRGRVVHSIGLGFTASSPLPACADGTPLSVLHPHEPHAYVKLWKHSSAQAWAERINARGGDFLALCGGRLPAEWLIAKAAQMADEAPHLWQETERFIEAGDWLVWQLSGQEVRSLSFAAYKAQYRPSLGYPHVVDGLSDKLRPPRPIGERAGCLTAAWRERTGIKGEAVVAVAVIDSHGVMPAVGAVQSGTLVGALGTSAAFMLLDEQQRPLPAGIEGMARDAVLPGFWCYEAGQAGFGDTLEWFICGLMQCQNTNVGFAHYNAAAAALPAGRSSLLALDWWSGCRVPLGDSALNGLLMGLNLKTTAVEVYRALLESLCYGTRRIVECLQAEGAPIQRILLTSGLSRSNPLLMQLMADILGRDLGVPKIPQASAVGAALHGAMAAGLVHSYADAARLYGCSDFFTYVPDPRASAAYEPLYRHYRELGENVKLREAMHALNA